MAMIKRGIHASGGDRFELRGRLLAHAAELERLARIIVASYFTQQEWDQPRFRLLYDHLLHRTSLDRLADLVKAIVRDQTDDVAELWAWLPRDLRQLATVRNAWAHLRAPWADPDVTLTDEQIVALLLKVDHGLADFGTGLRVLALGDEIPWHDEQHYVRSSTEAAPATLRELDDQRHRRQVEQPGDSDNRT